MNRIGFKTEAVVSENINQEKIVTTHPTSDQVDKLVQTRGWSLALFELEEYFSNVINPCLYGEERDRHLIEKLSKIRKRYFEKI